MKYAVLNSYIYIRISACCDGYGMVEEYSARAKQINQQFLCITDHGMMGSVPRQIRACEKDKINPLFGCLPKRTPIITKNGVKFIEDIKIGDEVLTHKGVFKKVIRTSIRKFKGLMYEIKLSDSNLNSIGFRLTGEHPVLIRNYKGEVEFIP